MSGLSILANHLLVCQSLSHRHLPVLAVTPNKEGYFVCLPAVLQCECSLSLLIPHGMHLVVPTHPYFLWGICHPSKTFPPKELSRNPKIGFSLSPLPDYAYLLLTHDLTTSCIGWVQANDVWALRVLHFYVYPKSAYCSCIRRGLEACLYILPPILGFLWSEPFSGFSFFKACSFWGWAFAWSWAFPPLAHSLALFYSLCVSCRTALPFLLWCYLTQTC